MAHMNDSLEDLLNSLSVDDGLSLSSGTVVAHPLPKQPPSKQPPSDDLEDLLASLDNPVSAVPSTTVPKKEREISPPAKSTTVASAGDDFDEILLSLESQSSFPAPAPVRSAAPPSAAAPQRAFAQIETRAPPPQPQPQKAPYVPPSAQKATVYQAPAPEPRKTAGAGDDLDSLLASLSETAELMPVESPWAAPSPQPRTATQPQPQPQQAVPQYRPPPQDQPQQAVPQYRPGPASPSQPSDEISSILSQLDTQFSPAGRAPAAPQTRQPAPVNDRLQKSNQDLNNLLNNLETEPTHDVPKQKSLVDVDLLKKQLYDEGYFDGDPSHMGGCAKCHRGISGQKIEAAGKSFHLDCWVCNSCQKTLLTSQYFLYESLPHCEPCYKNLYCPKCGKCDQIILGEVVTAMQKSWHPHCFCCSHCQKPFTAAFYQGRNGMPYCEQHYRIYSN